MDATERLRRYRLYVYEAGAVGRSDKSAAGVIDEKVLEEERTSLLSADSKDFGIAPDILRIRGLLERKALSPEITSDSRHLFQVKHDNNQNPSRGSMGCTLKAAFGTLIY